MDTAKTPSDRDTLAARVSAFPRVAASRPELKQAAVAVCVTEHEGAPALLLTRRNARLRAHAGQWALPGGRRETGETAEQGAVREVREEAGVWGRVIESLGTVEYEYERKGKRVAKQVEFFLIEYEGGDPKDHDHEIEEAKWMGLGKAADSLTFKGEREIVERAISRRGSGV